MSVTQVPLQPMKRATLVKLWAGLLLLALAAFLLARAGTAALQGETTASGLFFRTIDEGQGATIGAMDGALVEYEGRLADGTMFDSSQGRPVPMIPSQVIPGFGEALQKMKKGGRYHVRIPSALAYGATPPPGLPADADLSFDVRIVEVVPNAALMGAGPPPPGAGQPTP